jgi:hypothetical protein
VQDAETPFCGGCTPELMIAADIDAGVPLEPYTQPLAPDERKENGKKEE